eukprot:CAMPEP_0201944724 /NCGR_PEP_ID=MMETSP0903-20130614/53539_1 /ASSEMBLY_ACC=CAM_ASM_000552 /TAXON_ID=420261 /ORGANISM="Thalassiosira antarctica, Strain CCMP982" /LENGTH=763 /DNA_ID=CAMNT_0048487777 /DNA_START=171 /DNA_END=2460 /DNA_ORIENTATION=-
MSDPPQSSRSNVEPRDKERKLVNDNIRILGLFDTENWDWGEELFDYTMSMINDSNDGWQDDILGNGTYLEWDVKNSACDGITALRAYWADRTDNNDVPPHGLLGCRCSAASISSANLAGLDGVTQVSPASTAKELSDKSEYPFFARTVASNQFSAKAIVATFRGFSWDRVSILQTDTVFSTGLSTDFQQLWTGEHDDESGVWEGDIAYSHSIVINQDETVNEESVRRALNGVPTDDPINNSRVILLIAHDQHAFSVLKTATEMKFQPDTIWIGVDAWSNQYPSNMEDFMSGFPVDAHPGYLGITPYQPNDDHLNFLSTLQEAQRRDGKMPWPELPHYAAAQMIDSIQALVMALVATPSKDRRNGTAVMSHLLDLDFDGVGGRVRFTPSGDREDPQYSLLNFRRVNGGGASWVDIGKKETIGFTNEEMQKKIEAVKNIDNDLDNINQVVDDAKKRQASLIMKRAALQGTPSTWIDSPDTLVPVTPEDEEYWSVFEKMRVTIPNVHISKLWRVQNKSLWSYYSFHKDRLEMNDIQPNERRVWHGTSSLDPSIVYADKMDGFMMQFAAQGLWGRGIYFADKASYSKNYSHTPVKSQTSDRPAPKKAELEMFLSRLLVGKEVELNQNRALAVPPIDSRTGLKYNSVTGNTAGSQIWIVYENGRAYPEYLVRYYVGSRDESRSPYLSKKEASKSEKWSSCSFELEVSTSNLQPSASQLTARQGFWEYLSESGWVAYDAANQALIERTFQDFSVTATSPSIVVIKGPEW